MSDERPTGVSVPEQDPRPVVALPAASLPRSAIVGMIAVLAVILFIVIDGQRRRAALASVDRTEAAAISSPPPLVVPPEQLPTSLAVLTVTPTPAPAPLLPPPVPPAASPLPPQTIIVPVAPSTPSLVQEVRQSRQQPRLDEPALVIDGGAATSGSAAAINTPTTTSGPSNRGQAGAGSDDTPARATVIRSRTDVMPTGTLIPAVLETPIDSARPGFVRAVVSRDTGGFDGRKVLVPRGSRLIGEYQSDVRGGQNRVLVTWTRLIRPDGVSIRLGSPAADQMGGAGVRGRVQSFFLQRFAGAILQSALTVGVNIASRPGNGAVIVGVPSQPVNTINQQIASANDYRPKITVKQGAALNVFVARDLDFSGVGSAR